jgi:hypothetical protein
MQLKRRYRQDCSRDRYDIGREQSNTNKRRNHSREDRIADDRKRAAGDQIGLLGRIERAYLRGLQTKS